MTYSALYTIRHGETSISLAEKFNTTPEEILALNGSKPLMIRANQQIQVPESSRYRVTGQGESIRDLAIRYRLSPEELIQLNPDLILEPGQAVILKT